MRVANRNPYPVKVGRGEKTIVIPPYSIVEVNEVDNPLPKRVYVLDEPKVVKVDATANFVEKSSFEVKDE